MAQNATRSNNRISNDVTTPGYKTRSVVRDEARPRKSINGEDAEEFEFYPAFCFSASPTHFTWVKMSIADIHRLQPRKGFEGQNIYFYKNHPVQFVCLAGYIVSRDEYERRTVLTVDDSSGAILEVCILKAISTDCAGADADAGVGDDADDDAAKSENTTSATTRTTIPATSTATTTINVTSTTRSPVDISSLLVGTAVKIKGTLSSKFQRSSSSSSSSSSTAAVMQVVLERFWVLHDTTSEIRFWNERTRVLKDTLSHPWQLSAGEIETLRHQACSQEQSALRRRQQRIERQRRQQEREEKYQRRIVLKWEAEERLREKEDELVRLDNRRLEKWLALRRHES